MDKDRDTRRETFCEAAPFAERIGSFFDRRLKLAEANLVMSSWVFAQIPSEHPGVCLR